MEIPKSLTLNIDNISEDNRIVKFQKAIKEVSKQFKIPATIQQTAEHKEEFPYKAQEQLYNYYVDKIGLMNDEVYSRLCSTLGMGPANTFSKAIDPNAPKFLKGEIFWNPETGLPITQKDMDKLLEAVDKFMNRNPIKKEFTISQASIARILANLRKTSTEKELRAKNLSDLKYKGRLWDKINSYPMLNRMFPGDYDRLKFRERVVGNYITNITEETKAGIRDVLDEGFIAKKPKSQISQELFDKFGSLNKNWKRVVDTEASNIFNSEYIDEQKQDAEPGEPIYFIRREYNDGKTCSFCDKATQGDIIAKWSDVPLTDEKIDDPVASIAIWDGKSNISRSRKDWQWAQSSNHPHCYSDDTEVLTENGWKLFKDVDPLDKIMSINPDTREIDYLNHKGLISYQYDGEMIHFDGLNYDKLVTPDHNCLYKKSGKGIKLQQAKAKDLIGTDLMVPRAVGKWSGFDYELERQAESINVDPIFYAKLWGWFLSEGNVRTYDNRHEIKLSQKYTDKILHDTGDHDFFKIGKDAIYIFDRKIVQLFSEFSGVHAEQKYIPNFIRESSVKYITAFIESFKLGDGSERISESSNPKFGKSLEHVVRTSSPLMMAHLSELIVKMEKICSIHKHEGKGVAVQHNNGLYIGNTDCYNISILSSKFRHYHKTPQLSKVTGTYSKEIHKIPYSGMVYDVELVKWHFLLVKRNGKLAWSGNCRGFWDRYDPVIGDIKL